SYTTDSITVPNIFNFDSIEAGNSFNDISIRLGINFPGSRAILSDSNATPLIDRVKTSAISFPAVFLASKITSPGIVVKDPIPKLVHSDFKTNLKVVGEFRQFKTELTLKNLITVREPLVSPSRLVTYTNFTATTYTDLIKITGRSGTITDFTSNYIFDNNQLKLTRSTSSFVTLYFNNPNNNQPIGNIVTARVIGTKFDITVNVQNYTTDSITVPDVFSFENIESGNSLTDVYVRLGKNFSERRVSYSNSNVIPLIEKIKPLAAAFPNNLSSSKITVNTLLKEDTARLLSAGFKNIPKVVGEARTLRVENAAKSSVNLSEPIVLPSRLITRFISTATIYTDPIQITGRSGVSSNFTSYYIFENNQLTLSRSIGNFVTLYFVPPTTGVTLASFTIARLTGSNFDISVTIQSNTSDSITVPNIFNFDDLKSPGTINDLFVRLGRTVQDTEIRYSNANRVSLINYHKTPVEFNSQISITGKTKIKDRNFSTVETPRISTYKSIPSLRETANYQTQQITVSNTTATLLSQIINIGGVTKSTSTFVSYYINDLDTLSVSTQSTVTNTLLFDTTVPLGNTLPTSVKLFAYQIVNGVENLKYEIVLPIVSVTSNSVSVNWEVYEYRIKVQLITAVLVSGKTYNRYSSGLSVANLQKFRADKQTVFEINQIGKLSRQYEKLFSLPNNVTSSKFKQEIVIKGVERFIPQKTTIVTTSTATIVEPFAINVYGKTETTSTAVRWYYNEENILQTIPVGSNLVTLYFDGLPIYQKTSAPFIKLIAPNVNYEFIHPVISFTIDSVTIQDTGFIPSVSGMYFYWARIGQSYTYRYSDTGANPYLNSLKFVNFIDGVVSTSTFRPTTVNKNIEKFSFGTEIPRIGKTQSIPQLRDTLQVIGKTP
ncbi:hypothetical protein EBU71_13875, partial [bacterium]|nr:hypothetical protein [Candidatus Elulimicrobium humile]